MPTTAELIQRARERRREAKLQALEAQAKEQSAREELQAKIQAERERLRERAERARAPASAGGASRREAEAAAPNMPFTPVSTEAGAARNIPGAAMGEIERLLMEGLQNPAAAASGGRAVQQVQAASEGGATPTPQAPPLLTRQRTTTETGTKRIGSLTVPSRTTRTTTDVQPNVLSAAEALRLRMAQARQQRAEGQAFAETFSQFQSEFGDPQLAANVARAVQAGDTQRVARLLEGRKGFTDKFNRAQLEATRTQAQANRRLAELRASKARVSDLEAERLESEFSATPLSVLVGARTVGQATGGGGAGGRRGGSGTGGGFVGGSLRELRLATDQLFEDGDFKPEQAALAQSIAMASFDRGTVFAIKPGGFFEGDRTAFIPLRQVLATVERASAGNEAAEGRLVELGLFRRQDEDLVPVGELDPSDPNAVSSTMVTDLFLLRQDVERAAGTPLVPVPSAPRSADSLARRERQEGAAKPPKPKESARPAPSAEPSAAPGEARTVERSEETLGALLGRALNDAVGGLGRSAEEGLAAASEATLRGERAVLQNVGDLLFTAVGAEPERVPEMPGMAGHRIREAQERRRRAGGPPLTADELRRIVAGRREGRSRGAAELLSRRERLRRAGP